MRTSEITSSQSTAGPSRAATSSCTRRDAIGDRSSCAASPTKVRCRLVAVSMRSSMAFRVTASRLISSCSGSGTGNRMSARPAAVISSAPWRSDATVRSVWPTTQYVSSAIARIASGQPMIAALRTIRTLCSMRAASVATRTVLVPAFTPMTRNGSSPDDVRPGISRRDPERTSRSCLAESSEMPASAPGDAPMTRLSLSTTCTWTTPPLSASTGFGMRF